MIQCLFSNEMTAAAAPAARSAGSAFVAGCSGNSASTCVTRNAIVSGSCGLFLEVVDGNAFAFLRIASVKTSSIMRLQQCAAVAASLQV